MKLETTPDTSFSGELSATGYGDVHVALSTETEPSARIIPESDILFFNDLRDKLINSSVELKDGFDSKLEAKVVAARLEMYISELSETALDSALAMEEIGVSNEEIVKVLIEQLALEAGVVSYQVEYGHAKASFVERLSHEITGRRTEGQAGKKMRKVGGLAVKAAIGAGTGFALGAATGIDLEVALPAAGAALPLIKAGMDVAAEELLENTRDHIYDRLSSLSMTELEHIVAENVISQTGIKPDALEKSVLAEAGGVVEKSINSLAPVVVDADLNDKPELIEKLMNRIRPVLQEATGIDGAIERDLTKGVVSKSLGAMGREALNSF